MTRLQSSIGTMACALLISAAIGVSIACIFVVALTITGGR